MNLLDAATKGIGIYSIAEASRYARIHQNTLRKWFGGESDRVPLHTRQIETEGFKALSFLDFVEAVAIRSLRVDYHVSFHKIREALKQAKDRYRIEYPFAHAKHRTVVIGNDLHIFFSDDHNFPVQLTGKHIGQKSNQCIQEYIRDLDFDQEGIASLYRAFQFKGQEVVMNPKVHFGEPILRGSGYTAETLYRAAVAEGSIERAAKLYEVSEDAVEAAYRYWNQELALAA